LRQLGEQRGNVKQAESGANEDAKRGQEEATTRLNTAKAANEENPAPTEPTNAFQLWHQQNPQGTLTDFNTENAKATPAGKPDLHTMYAEAVKTALDKGVDPGQDPHVQTVAESIKALQKESPDKVQNSNDKSIAIYAKPPAQRTPEETSWLKGYEQNVKVNKSDPGVARMQVLVNGRMMPALDTEAGNAPTFASPGDIKAHPGQYMPTGPGTQALNKTALLEDIRGNVQQVRSSLGAIPEFTAEDKVKIAVAMRSKDPASAVSSLLQSATAGSMSPHQQEYLINLANLVENAMAMRAVLGAGQGSEDLRDAIKATIPGPTTPNKAYASKQLDQFEKVLDRLSRGVPQVKLRGEAPATEGGGTVHFVDGAESYDIPPEKMKRFQELHPQAKRQ
jgi:hypothetical protein